MNQRLLRDDAPDAGFTLMEVLVALALIGIVASASLVFFVNGTRSVTTQQRQQNATTVANEAMEDAYSRIAKFSTTRTSGVVVGRTKAEVEAAWTAGITAGVVGLSDAFPDWDASTAPPPATGIADDAVPLRVEVVESRIKYTVTTLFGSCYRSTTLAAGACTKFGGNASWVPSAGYQRMIRAAVMVTWPDVTGNCGGTVCTYNISSLIDPNHDLEWNNTTRILAADDAVTVDADDTVLIDVLDNDTLPQLTANPVSVMTQPVRAVGGQASGTATLEASTGKILYDPSDDAHGEVTFTYKVVVGASTTLGTVHAYVNPMANNYPGNGSIGTASQIVVKTKWGAVPKSIELASAPGKGTVSILGADRFVYTATSGGTDTFTYRYTDSEDFVSLVGTVTMTNYAAATNPTGLPPKSIPGLSVDYVMNMQTDTGNPSVYKVRVTGGVSPTGPTMKLDGVAAAVGVDGSDLRFTPPPNTSGTYTFPFRIVDPAGVASVERTRTVQVQPAAGNDAPASIRRGTTNNTLSLGANDTYKGTKFVPVSPFPTGCGSLTVNQSTWQSAGTVSWNAPSSVPTGGTCTFTYKLESLSGLTTTPNVTVTMTVRS